MAYPPTPPVNTRTDSTPLPTNHAADHNAISNALTDIINELGTDPKGDSASVDARFDVVCPLGAVLPYAGGSAPSGWGLCDGSAVSRTTYAELFALIGTTFGAGDGSTTFNLPDLRSQFIAGKGAASWSNAVAQNGGSKDAVVVEHTHTDTLAAPAHTHGAGSFIIDSSTRFGGSQGFVGTGSAGANDYFPSYNVSGAPTYGFTMSTTDLAVTGTSGGASATALTGSIDNTGVSGTDANLPPYLTLNHIIRLT